MKSILWIVLSALIPGVSAQAAPLRPTYSCICEGDACDSVKFYAKRRFKDALGEIRVEFEIEQVSQSGASRFSDASMSLKEYQQSQKSKGFRLMVLGDRSISFGGATTDVMSLYEVHAGKGVAVTPDETGAMVVQQIRCQ